MSALKMMLAAGTVIAAMSAAALGQSAEASSDAQPEVSRTIDAVDPQAVTPDWVADAGRALKTRSVVGVVLNLDTRPGLPVVTDLQLGSQMHRIVLTPHSVRGPSFALMVDGDEGLTQKASAPVATLRGWVEGEEGSIAAGGMLEEGLFATVIDGEGHQWWIEPASRLMREGVKAPRGAHVVYRGEDSTDRSVVCTTDDAGAITPNGDGAAGGGIGSVGVRGLTKRVAQLAVDAEFRFYSITGSVARTQTMVETLVNIINVQYEREVDITHQISTIIIRTTAVYDPSGPDYLDQMTARWNANHAGVTRDAAIMIHAQGNGGRAWIGQVCNLGSAYGVNGIERGGLGFSCNLIAHELGHMWNACHCPCGNPPFTMDPVANGSNRFAGSPGSDCGPASVDQIVTFRNSRPCLGSTSSMHVIPNDDCADAVRLFANPESTGWGDTFGFSTIGANTDGPLSTCRPGGADIWYRVVAPCNGTMFVSTCGSGGSSFDTVLTAYGPGGTCPPAQAFQIACSDNDASCTSVPTGSRITFSTTAGQEYLVRVLGAGFPPQSGLGILTFSHTGCPRPPNDSCPSAAPVSIGVDTPFSTVGATTGARLEGGASNPHDSFLECLAFGDEQVASDIWFVATAPCSGQLRVRTCGSGYDTKIAVYGGSCPTADRTALACNDDASGTCGLGSEVTVSVSMGAQVLIRVGGYNGIEGSGVLRVDALNCAPPFNNLCQTATTLSGVSGSFNNGTLAGAAAELTASCTGTPQPDVWFYYIPPCDGTFGFSTCGTSDLSGYATTISMHSGCPGTESNRLACGNSGTGCRGIPAPPPDASASAGVTAGQVVYIRVAALSSTPPQFPARLQYQWAFVAPPPVNDACAGAIELTNGLIYCTAGATPSSEGLATCTPAPGAGDIWFRYTAGCNGNATINLCGAQFDTHLTVFAGSSCASLGNAVACNDNGAGCDGNGSTVSFPVTSGQTYLVRIGGGASGGDPGRGTISLLCIPGINTSGACCNGSFCTVRSLGNCNLLGGTFRGIGSVCSPNPCAPPCPADINGSGTLTVQDIFDFLALYFGRDARADFNGSGAISVQDIFDFLAAYFAGCN